MKKNFMAILLMIMLFVSCGSKEPVYEVRKIDGVTILYDIANNKKANGIVEGYALDEDNVKFLNSKSEYKDGLLHGKVEYFNDNGQLYCTEFYKNGMPDGKSVTYVFTEQGKYTSHEEEYRDGVLISQQFYNPKNQLLSSFKKVKNGAYQERYNPDDGSRISLVIKDRYGFNKVITENPEISANDLLNISYPAEDFVKYYTSYFEIDTYSYTGEFPLELRIDYNTDDPDIHAIVNLSMPVDVLYKDPEWFLENGNKLGSTVQDILFNGYVVISGSFDENGNLLDYMVMSTSPDNPGYVAAYGKNPPLYNGIAKLNNNTERSVFTALSTTLTSCYSLALQNKNEWYDKPRNN